MIFILLAVLSTSAILLCGVLLMARGGSLNKKYSNKLMCLRVGVQAVSIIVILVIYYLNKVG